MIEAMSLGGSSFTDDGIECEGPGSAITPVADQPTGVLASEKEIHDEPMSHE